MKILIYDCEIINAIPDPKRLKSPKVTYCEGWEDHKNMGISVIGCNYMDEHQDILIPVLNKPFEGKTDLVKDLAYQEMDNFQDSLDNIDVLVGFNNHHFDDKLLAANDFVIPDKVINYDILAEVWEAAGLPRTFEYPRSIGFSLDAICAANGIQRKTGSGANAALLWQNGKHQKVVDYCMNDIMMTTFLFTLIQNQGFIKDPRRWNFNFAKYNKGFEFKDIQVKSLHTVIKENHEQE